MFKQNIDKKGKWIRFVIACLLLVFAIWEHSWIAFFFSLFVFFESFMSWCLVNQLLGRTDCPIESKNSDKDQL